MKSNRAGFGLVEFAVALTLLAIGVLGLAAAALVAQQNFSGAATAENATRAAAVAIDSLLSVDTPTDGAAEIMGNAVSWSVSVDSTLVTLRTTVVSAAADTMTFDAARAR